MKIFFSKNNYYFERNVGIEHTPRTGMFVFYLLNLFREIVPPVGLEPTRDNAHQIFMPLQFSLPIDFNYCLWSGLGLNHIEFCARLMCIVSVL